MIKTFIIFGMMCFFDPKLEDKFPKCFNIIDQPFIYYQGRENCLTAVEMRSKILRETFTKKGLIITEGYISCLEVYPNVNT